MNQELFDIWKEMTANSRTCLTDGWNGNYKVASEGTGKMQKKLLGKEQNDYSKCTRDLDLWGSDALTGVQSHWTGMIRGIC